MTLGEYIEMLEKYDPHTMLKKGLSKPDSWRGSYNECSFAVVENITVGEMIKSAKDFLKKGRMTGYKGGVFEVTEYTDINIDSYSEWSDGKAMWRFLIELMMSEGNAEHTLIL